MVENQRICILPVNDRSTTLFYDTRVVISVPMKEPLVWKISKVETNNPKGVIYFTFAQDRWNEHTDAFEYEHEDGKDDFSSIYDPARRVVGMYADYYESNIEPKDPEIHLSNIYGEFTYSGQPQVKIGGSYKKFIVTFYDKGNEISLPSGNWKYEIDGNDASYLLSTIESNEIVKVKFNGGDEWAGSILQIKYMTTTGKEASIDVELIGL